MIRSYKFINTVHFKLHEYVIAFFRKIEIDTIGFRDELFETDFLPIVNRHKKILRERFERIYLYTANLSDNDRHDFCEKVFDSNEIEKICRGEKKPSKIDKNASGIEEIVRDLFLDLYTNVLDGDPFREENNTTLRDHFDQFSKINEDITLCPICGIGELKKFQDLTRDQYDHYLPKSLYPLSSVNFYNLVPCCTDCNSPQIKGSKDIIMISNGKLFFPYDMTHKGISLTISVSRDNLELENIDWGFTFTNPENKKNEIEAWKKIYSIESRYNGYIKVRIKKWYTHFINLMSIPRKNTINFIDMKEFYMQCLEEDKNLGINFIRKPTLDAFLSGSNIAQAQIQALEYA